MTFNGPPARLKFEGRSYMLDPDERNVFRGVEVIRAPSSFVPNMAQDSFRVGDYPPRES